MAQVLFLLQRPTPQRNPVLDELARDGVDLLALYRAGAVDDRGWGPLTPQHRHDAIPPGLLRGCVRVAGELLSRDVRVLCCFGYRAPAFALAVLLARARRIRVVTRSDSNWSHESTRPRARRLVKRLLLRALFGRRTRVWTVGTQNERYWAQMGLPDRHLIPYGMPEPPVGTPEQGAAFRAAHGLGVGPVLLFVGMLEPWKGVDTLLEAFAAVPDPAARLVVVGKGSLAGLVDEAARRDLRVVACGPLPQGELGPAYAAADVFVLPSRRDAWGLVVNEAQANGLRVVVSDAVGAGVDLVRPESGWRFPAGDAAALAGVLREAVAGRRAGAPRLPAAPPYDAAPAMLADLVRLGVSARGGAGAAQGASGRMSVARGPK